MFSAPEEVECPFGGVLLLIDISREQRNFTNADARFKKPSGQVCGAEVPKRMLHVIRGCTADSEWLLTGLRPEDEGAERASGTVAQFHCVTTRSALRQQKCSAPERSILQEGEQAPKYGPPPISSMPGR